MKRFYFPLLLMAAAAVAACQNKAAVEEPAQGNYVFTLRATSPDLDTKTDYTSTGKFSWSAGDQISVLFHNGDENKFFTLTNTSGAGASADFSGTIDEGYEIGASDGSDSDKKIWALYPASDNHSFTVGSYPKFFIPSEIDFTAPGAHYSANMPMCAQVASEDDVFAFNHLAAAFKFSFTDVSVEKVKFVIENLKTYQFSDLIPIALNGDELFMNSGYADVGSKKGSLTMTANVVDGDVSFYVPVRYWGNYQPKISLYDANDDGLIYTNTAAVAKQLTNLGEIKPITISVSGAVITPWSYESAFGVDWTASDVVSAAGAPGINSIKAIADDTYLYVLLEIKKDALTLNPEHTRDNSVNIHCNTSSRYFGYLAENGIPQLNDNSGYIKGKTVSEHKGILYYEWKISRSEAAQKTELAPMGKAGTISLRFCVYPNNSTSGTDWNTYMYAPANSGLEVSLP